MFFFLECGKSHARSDQICTRLQLWVGEDLDAQLGKGRDPSSHQGRRKSVIKRLLLHLHNL